MTEDKQPCTHERETTEMLASFRTTAYGSSGKDYEVYCCLDCGRLVNYLKPDDVTMTPDEIMQMFVDLNAHFMTNADEIVGQAQELFKKLETTMLDKMPKVKK